MTLTYFECLSPGKSLCCMIQANTALSSLLMNALKLCFKGTQQSFLSVIFYDSVPTGASVSTSETLLSTNFVEQCSQVRFLHKPVSARRQHRKTPPLNSPTTTKPVSDKATVKLSSDWAIKTTTTPFVFLTGNLLQLSATVSDL